MRKKRDVGISVRERPIIFSAPMIRALLAGTKTQTRRVVKGLRPQIEHATHTLPRRGETHNGMVEWWAGKIFVEDGRCPYGQPGDRLWVREAWRYQCDIGNLFDCIEYRCDGARRKPEFDRFPSVEQYTWHRFSDRCEHSHNSGGEGWRSPIHMPRWSSRITLEITDVRVQRVQDISEEDAKAEGIRWTEGGPLHAHIWLSHVGGECNFPTARDAYRGLWNDINGDASWDSDPWCWCLNFKRVSP